MSITDEKLKAAIQIALGSHGIYTEKIESDLIHHIKALSIPIVVSSLTAKDKLYLNTLLVNKLLEKEDDGTYKAVNDIGIMNKINDLMEKVNNS